MDDHVCVCHIYASTNLIYSVMWSWTDESVGVDLHSLGQSDQVHLPRPD
jgi:hypothetical protein